MEAFPTSPIRTAQLTELAAAPRVLCLSGPHLVALGLNLGLNLGAWQVLTRALPSTSSSVHLVGGGGHVSSLCSEAWEALTSFP